MSIGKELRKSGVEFARRVFHRGYIVLFGVAGSVLGTYGDLFGEAVKLPPWASWGIVAGSLLVACFWAFHDLRVEKDDAASVAGRDQRYDALSDLLGKSLTAGVELSENGEWPPLRAWSAYTKCLITCAYGDGEAAHIFTPELKGSKVHRGGSMMFTLMERPPPLAETINSVKALLARMNSMAIRAEFRPAEWKAFDPAAFKAEYGRPIGEGNGKYDWVCPWCSRELNGLSSNDCDSCGAESAGDFAYRSWADFLEGVSPCKAA